MSHWQKYAFGLILVCFQGMSCYWGINFILPWLSFLSRIIKITKKTRIPLVSWERTFWLFFPDQWIMRRSNKVIIGLIALRQCLHNKEWKKKSNVIWFERTVNRFINRFILKALSYFDGWKMSWRLVNCLVSLSSLP